MTVDAPKINVVFRANLGPSIMRRRSVVKFVLRPLFFRWIGRKEGRERKKEVSLSFVLSTDVSPIIPSVRALGACQDCSIADRSRSTIHSVRRENGSELKIQREKEIIVTLIFENVDSDDHFLKSSQQGKS